MNFSQLLSFKYFFTLRPGVFSAETKQIVFIVFCACLVLFFVFRLLAYLRKEQPPLAKLFKKIYIFWLVNALIGFIWLFFRAEAVPLLGARFWILFLFIADLVWLFYIVKYGVKQMPKEKKEKEEWKQFKKYLPK